MVIFLFSLAACVGSDFPRSLPVSENSELQTSQPTDAPTKPISPTLPTPTVIPQETQETVRIDQKLTCEEDFCQVEWTGWLVRPFSGQGRNQIDLTYPYASKGDGSLAIHHGVEFPNPYGTPVYAAADGKVLYAGNDRELVFGPYPNFYGNLVILQHHSILNGEDIFTLYGHLSALDVEEGESVTAGDMLGKVGATGVADGSHMHFEVRYAQNEYSTSTNPVLWFSPSDVNGPGQSSTLAGRISDAFGNPVPEASFTLERLSENGTPEKYYYFETYAQNGVNPHQLLQENFAIPDLPPGDYRLTYISGTMYEIFFTLQPGMLGFVNLELN